MTPEQVAEYVAQKARQDPEIRAKIQDVRMFDGLREHQGFQHLRKKVAEQQDGFADRIARKILTGGEVDQREIDYMRGYIEGAMFVVMRPEVAERNLELAGRLAYALGKRELEAEGEMAPNA